MDYTLLRIENGDLLKLVSYFNRANQFHYDGWLTQAEFSADSCGNGAVALLDGIF